MSKIYIENSRFMEFIDEIATRMTELEFGEDTTKEIPLKRGGSNDTAIVFTDEAQDYYNEAYDEYEGIANRLLGVYSNNELNK